VRDIDLLGAGGKVARKVAKRGASGLKFRVGIKSVVVIEIIIAGEFLVGRELMIDANLKLVPTIAGSKQAEGTTLTLGLTAVAKIVL
jgi:hypothetical protein